MNSVLACLDHQQKRLVRTDSYAIGETEIVEYGARRFRFWIVGEQTSVALMLKNIERAGISGVACELTYLVSPMVSLQFSRKGKRRNARTHH